MGSMALSPPTVDAAHFGMVCVDVAAFAMLFGTSILNPNKSSLLHAPT